MKNLWKILHILQVYFNSTWLRHSFGLVIGSIWSRPTGRPSGLANTQPACGRRHACDEFRVSDPEKRNAWPARWENESIWHSSTVQCTSSPLNRSLERNKILARHALSPNGMWIGAGWHYWLTVYRDTPIVPAGRLHGGMGEAGGGDNGVDWRGMRLYLTL